LRNILTNGVNFPVEELDEVLLAQELKAAFVRGNHGSASKNYEFLSDAISKEVRKGWNIILPLGKYLHIPDIVLNTIGVATYVCIGSDGTFVDKDHLTHDLSFP